MKESFDRLAKNVHAINHGEANVDHVALMNHNGAPAVERANQGSNAGTELYKRFYGKKQP